MDEIEEIYKHPQGEKHKIWMTFQNKMNNLCNLKLEKIINLDLKRNFKI